MQIISSMDFASSLEGRRLLGFGMVSWPNVMGLEARLGRIHEDIVRTIKETKANRLIM
jgi:hypothetical protein